MGAQVSARNPAERASRPRRRAGVGANYRDLRGRGFWALDREIRHFFRPNQKLITADEFDGIFSLLLDARVLHIYLCTL